MKLLCWQATFGHCGVVNAALAKDQCVRQAKLHVKHDTDQMNSTNWHEVVRPCKFSTLLDQSCCAGVGIDSSQHKAQY